MIIADKVRELSIRVQRAVVAFQNLEKPKAADLNKLVQDGAVVVAMMGSEGYAAIQKERQAQEEIILSRFLGSEVTSWEKFVELRGYANGMLASFDIETQIISAGIKAEKKLEHNRNRP